MSRGGPDARGLEGKSEGEEEEGKITPREFFWDSITLYVVFAIISLSSIDLVIEFIRQPEVRCFSRDNQDELEGFQDYVNEFCYGTSALSNINIFRISSYILGFGIAALHYLWLNRFGGRFAFFFQLASDIERHREEDSGEYPKSNLIIADQLEDSFTTYKQNTIFVVYFIKLVLQLLFGLAGIIGIGYYFTQLRFDTSFTCPETMTEANDTSGPWPLLGEQVTCVYTSFPLLELVCIADLVLLGIMSILLLLSLVWCTASHTIELGYKDIAAFVFQTGLPSRYFTPDFELPERPNWFQKLYLCFSSVPWFPLRGPRIKTDLDFMMMRLFRTDGGLGHVLKDVLILKEVKILNDTDRRIYFLHRQEQKVEEFKTQDLIEKQDISDLHWIFDKSSDDGRVHEDGVYDPDNLGEMQQNAEGKTVFRVPYTIRGAVLGFSSYVQDRTFALCVSFGSPSTGFATALGRVFSKVASIDFNPYYYNEEKSIEKKETDQITTLRCAEDVLSTATTTEDLLSVVSEVWDTLKVNFLVVAPLTNSFHKSMLSYLIYLLKDNDYLADDAVLLTICPLAISGRRFNRSQARQQSAREKERDFYQYIPLKTFFPKSVDHKVQVIKDKPLIWPKFDTENNNAVTTPSLSSDQLPVYVVDASKNLELKTEMCFRMFAPEPEGDDDDDASSAHSNASSAKSSVKSRSSRSSQLSHSHRSVSMETPQETNL